MAVLPFTNMSGDLEQIARGDIVGQAGRLTFSRSAPGVGGVPVAVATTDAWVESVSSGAELTGSDLGSSAMQGRAEH